MARILPRLRGNMAHALCYHLWPLQIVCIVFYFKWFVFLCYFFLMSISVTNHVNENGHSGLKDCVLPKTFLWGIIPMSNHSSPGGWGGFNDKWIVVGLEKNLMWPKANGEERGNWSWCERKVIGRWDPRVWTGRQVSAIYIVQTRSAKWNYLPVWKLTNVFWKKNFYCCSVMKFVWSSLFW